MNAQLLFTRADSVHVSIRGSGVQCDVLF